MQYAQFSSGSYALTPYLLQCKRGRHSGERIAAAFEEIIEEYGISRKISYIITDNAAIMKCAFNSQQQADDAESEGEQLDDVGTVVGGHGLRGHTELLDSTWERLSCFAYSLQLVVSDGMKEVKSIGLAKPQDSPLSRIVALNLKTNLRPCLTQQTVSLQPTMEQNR